jgi:molybdenum cofactor guanylyltransferase
MGRDKAGVLVDGQSLWQRQLSTLRDLHPAELLISGKPDGPYGAAGIEIIPDLTPDRGPLSGLEAALQCASHPLVLVLAIDLPSMTTAFLSSLTSRVSKGDETAHGCVPCLDGWFEPLAAIYPRRSLSLVQECLRGDDFSMQSFVRRAVALDLVRSLHVTSQDAHHFRNLNTPADLSGDNL